MEKIKGIKSWISKQDELLHQKLDELSPKNKLVVVLALSAVFALCALFSLGTALYQIGRNEGQEVEIEHIKQIDFHPKQDSINPYK
jgi:hypothetical protein